MVFTLIVTHIRLSIYQWGAFLMAKTKIDDIKKDAEELDAAEQKATKGSGRAGWRPPGGRRRSATTSLESEELLSSDAPSEEARLKQ